MDALEKSAPRKNTKISFRTDELTLAKLKAACRIENKTISSLIEDVLTEHVLRQEAPMTSPDEKRQCQRKQCSISAVIFSTKDESAFFYHGTIVDMSLSSMQILLKNVHAEHAFQSGFEILFSLPHCDYPMLLPCRFVRASYLHGETMLVAHFKSTNPVEENIIKHFLTNCNLTNDSLAKKRHR
ncbi:PilZ domain-containing protein [Desulfomicrobium salsuginis]